MITLQATGTPDSCCAQLRDEMRQEEALDRRAAAHLDVIIERAVYVLASPSEETIAVTVQIEPRQSLSVVLT